MKNLNTLLTGFFSITSLLTLIAFTSVVIENIKNSIVTTQPMIVCQLVVMAVIGLVFCLMVSLFLNSVKSK